MKATKQIIFCVIFWVLLLGVLLLAGCSMASLPEGELLQTYFSPDNRYALHIYLCDGGATTDYAIRGELVDETTNAVKNIYWNYHESDAVVQWEDEDTVTINGHTLNVPEDSYDWRTEP